MFFLIMKRLIYKIFTEIVDLYLEYRYIWNKGWGNFRQGLGKETQPGVNL